MENLQREAGRGEWGKFSYTARRYEDAAEFLEQITLPVYFVTNSDDRYIYESMEKNGIHPAGVFTSEQANKKHLAEQRGKSSSGWSGRSGKSDGGAEKDQGDGKYIINESSVVVLPAGMLKLFRRDFRTFS